MTNDRGITIEEKNQVAQEVYGEEYANLGTSKQHSVEGKIGETRRRSAHKVGQQDESSARQNDNEGQPRKGLSE